MILLALAWALVLPSPRATAGRKPQPAAKGNTKKGSATKSSSKGSSSRSASSARGKKSASKSGGKGSAAKSTAAARKPAPPKRVAPTLDEQIRPDSAWGEDLAEGISHTRITTASRQVVDVVTLDLKKGARLRTYKALARCDGLQRACDIGMQATGDLGDTVVAATNASFWRAGSNTPIGATITGGEVVEMPGYKQWSSLLIHDDGSASIDRIALRGELFWKGHAFPIEGVNRRGDAAGPVVYNRYYGDSIPRGSRKSDSAIIAEAVANKVGADVGDETETIDSAGLIRAYRAARVMEDAEHPLLKIACRPLRPKKKRDPIPAPSIGDTMAMVITAVDTGVVVRPADGYVISLGTSTEDLDLARVGDTVRLLYTLTPRQPRAVREALTGTPRLVRERRGGQHEQDGGGAEDERAHETAVADLGESGQGGWPL